jgi:hypothetical protein
MKVTQNKLVEIHQYRRGVEFEGAAPEVYHGDTHRGKRWIPDYAYAQWNHGEPIEEISVRGAILKQDGTPGQHRGDITYYTPACAWWARSFRRAPQWVLDLFADSPNASDWWPLDAAGEG